MKIYTRLILLGVALVIGHGSLLAQRAQITGRVTDSSGAVVAGTSISATNAGTGIEWDATTNEIGYYTIPLLPPGRYNLLAQKTDFRPISRSGVVLEVNQVVRIDFVVEVGRVTESVTVSGEVPPVQTEDSSLGTVVERQRIEELPLNGRNVFNLVKLVAGVQSRSNTTDGFADTGMKQFSQMRFNGGPVYGNQVSLDGGMNTNPVHNEISVVPMVDAVEEFRVETNALKAEFGQTSGGVINVATKSGTNAWHGSLYEFVRNDSLDARNAFATQVDPATGRIKPVLRYNQYGGTVGGPVRLPRIYDGRKRTFFFFGYEQWRHRSSPIRRATVPTLAERTGNYANTRDGRGALIPIYDPATTRPNPAGAGWVRDAFPGNVIPANRLDRLSQRILEFMPLPNAIPDDPFTQANNFIALQSQPIDMGTTNARVDHRFSDKDSFFARFTRQHYTQGIVGYGLGVADPITNAGVLTQPTQNALFSETHVLSPNVINEFRVAGIRQNLRFQHPSSFQNWPEQLGMSPILPQELFPTVNISGMLQLGPSPYPTGVRASAYLQLIDSVTLIKGRHRLKAGVDHRWFRLNWQMYRYPSGQYSFSAGLTGDPQRPAGTGVGMASYVLGEVGGGSLLIQPAFSFQSWSNATYIQDDIKVTPRLTLNLGIRYDLASGPAERWNRYSNFDPFIQNPDTGMAGVLKYAGTTAPRHFVGRDYNNFGPRVGFAYDITGDARTVIRGGYGVIYLLVDSADTQGDGSNALGFQGVTPFNPPALGPFKAFQFSAGPPTILQPLGPAGGPSAFRGSDVQFQDYNARTPYLQQWNLTLQRALPGKWVTSASYTGNRGVKLFGADYDMNQLDPRYFTLGLGLQDQVSNPFFGKITSGSLSGATVVRSQLLKPYPDYLGVYTFVSHGASSVYHSLQVTAERRYAGGFGALVSYTNGKLINDSFSSAGSAGRLGDFRIGRFNRRLDRALDQEDVSQRLVASGTFELPFGPGKPFLGTARGLLDYVAAGWQVNTITTLQTGFPLVVRGANNFSGINWPDVVRNPTLPGSERTQYRWFDTEAFRNPADFTIGNVARTLPSTRGPGLTDVQFSAFKTFRIREGANLEFRVEMFNALNNVQLNTPNTTFSPNRAGVNTNSNFSRITSSLNARSIQLGLRLAF